VLPPIRSSLVLSSALPLSFGGSSNYAVNAYP
jgi:hypothetical protein